MEFTGTGKTQTDAYASLFENLDRFGLNINALVGIEETVDNVETFPPGKEVTVSIERDSNGSAGYAICQTYINGSNQLRLFMANIKSEVKSKHGLFDYLEITHVNGLSVEGNDTWDIYSREAIGNNTFSITVINHPFTVATLTRKINRDGMPDI
jgi:hypothetical protein